MQRAVFLVFPSTEDPQKALLQLEGNLDISQAAYLKKKFEQALSEYKNIEIKGGNLAYLDLSFVQLFHAFRKEAESKNIQLSYHFDLEEDLSSLIQKAGLEL